MSVSSDLRFIDTNVMVYAYDETAGEKHDYARQLVDALWVSGTGCLSVQVLQEFYVTVTQKLSVPVDQATAALIVRDLARWNVHAPGVDDISGAIDLHHRYQISLWDALVIWSAASLGCSVLLTEDLNSGQIYDGVRVQNPFL